MVGLQVLDLAILVRIQVPEPRPIAPNGLRRNANVSAPTSGRVGLYPKNPLTRIFGVPSFASSEAKFLVIHFFLTYFELN